MRKALIGIFMAATMTTPLWAAPGEHGGRAARQNEDDSAQPQRAERQAQRAERQAERQQQQVQQVQARQVQAQQVQAQQNFQARGNRGDGQGWRGRGDSGQAQQSQQVQTQQSYQARGNRGDGQSWRGRGDSGQAQQSQQTQQSWQGRSGGDDSYRRQIEESREASRRSAQDGTPELQRKAAQNQARYEQSLRDRRRDGSGNWDRDRRGNDGRDWNRNRGNDGRNWNRDGRNGRNWNRDWRNDRRYDWQGYRYSNRNIFHIGPYYAPYRDYRYNRLSIGLFLDSVFFGRNYWIDDPFYYRLPPADYGTHWVRYYNDVVLVDDYTGEVLDVIYDFFW
jgi:hypothetical protein